MTSPQATQEKFTSPQQSMPVTLMGMALHQIKQRDRMHGSPCYCEADAATLRQWHDSESLPDDRHSAITDEAAAATPSLDVDRCEQKDGAMACGRVIGQDGCSVHGRSVWPWPEACCYRNAFEEASHSRTCSRYSEYDRLARLDEGSATPDQER